MTSFKRLNTEKYLKAARLQTEDTAYWKKLSVSCKKWSKIRNFLGYDTHIGIARFLFEC